MCFSVFLAPAGSSELCQACVSWESQDESDKGWVSVTGRRAKVATVRLWVRAIAGRCSLGVYWTALRTAFGRERRVPKVSTRKCARARVWGRGSKQQQPTRQFGQKLESPFPTRKCVLAEPGGELEGAGPGALCFWGFGLLVPGALLAPVERPEWR